MDKLHIELKKAYGENAKFREGQREAVEDLINGNSLLVVQKTGWGKSLIYFLTTKIMRKQGKGITLIISPLLALMNNQIDSAKKLGLNVATINSNNVGDWDYITEELNRDNIDALIISPERLANAHFKKMLMERFTSRISFFVVDEAHCISDWGHDFRPDYRRIVDIINVLPSNIPVLATTATANNRVINDIKKELGDNLIIRRGSLMRESLALQIIEIYSKEARLAWLAENIHKIPGTGIIYCLTINDCQLVYKWLMSNGIPSDIYNSRIDIEKKDEVINAFMNNEIKVLVATVAFGMGFDKPDIGFVIHFQRPGNIISYYQQIGRAGRQIEHAYAILLCGGEDNDINNYFIDTAFPTESLMNEIVNIITECPGIRTSQINRFVNMKPSKIKACLKYLLVNGDIFIEKGQYYKSNRIWKPDLAKSREITEIRKKELKQMEEFIRYKNCHMEYISKELDDLMARPCGHCSNCLGRQLYRTEVTESVVLKAQQFIREDFNIIEPRKRLPPGEKLDGKNRIPKELQCDIGRVLSNYGDAGWGKLVVKGKYDDCFFNNQMVDAAVLLLEDYVKENDIKWVTSIPSIRRPELVNSYAKRLASRLGLRYYDIIEKVNDNKPQKELNNSHLQYMNAYSSFEVKTSYSDNVLLVDDMVDSRWTFTVCGYKLRMSGSGRVFPFALANSSGRGGDV